MSDNDGAPPSPSPDAAALLLREVDAGGSAILLRRPARLSVAFRSPPPRGKNSDELHAAAAGENGGGRSVLAGWRLDTAPDGTVAIRGRQDDDEFDKGDVGMIDWDVNCCARREGSRHSPTFLAVGDRVEYACGVDCRPETSAAAAPSPEAGTDDGAGHRLAWRPSGSSDEDGATAPRAELLHSKVREYSSDEYVTTVCVSTTPSASDPMSLRQATILLSNRSDGDAADIDIAFAQRDDGRLVVSSISSRGRDGGFGSSGGAIRAGHVVVGINEYIASMLAPADAAALVRSIVDVPTSSHLSITTIAPMDESMADAAATKWNTLRKAAVTAGGTTLVGAGAVLMVTPLHPLGHALALGGVGVLGTEYEGSRRAVAGAKERWGEMSSRWREKGRSWRSRWSHQGEEDVDAAPPERSSTG